MKKRFFFIGLLILAFLISAWGNVIAAAFCPRYLSNRECYIRHEPRQPKQVDDKSSCHHEMSDMEMGDMQMDDTEMESQALETEDNSTIKNSPTQVATESYAELVAIDLPTEPCGHCWMHSQSASGTATLVAADPSKRSLETSAPPADFVVALPSAFIVPITPLEHGPPGNSFPRHVLINVFRI